jgi:hypothetical protein
MEINVDTHEIIVDVIPQSIEVELNLNEITVTSDAVAVPLKGDKGDSAYTIAVRNGFVGTEQEWLANLRAIGELQWDSTNW